MVALKRTDLMLAYGKAWSWQQASARHSQAESCGCVGVGWVGFDLNWMLLTAVVSMVLKLLDAKLTNMFGEAVMHVSDCSLRFDEIMLAYQAKLTLAYDTKSTKHIFESVHSHS